ncbi:MAG: hypothetical protein LQ340_006742, partial [Diploschistes diacapsis]
MSSSRPFSSTSSTNANLSASTMSSSTFSTATTKAPPSSSSTSQHTAAAPTSSIASLQHLRPSPSPGLRVPSNRKTIYDRNLNRTRAAELSRASFSYLFAEMVVYAQRKVTGIQDLERRW